MAGKHGRCSIHPKKLAKGPQSDGVWGFQI